MQRCTKPRGGGMKLRPCSINAEAGRICPCTTVQTAMISGGSRQSGRSPKKAHNRSCSSTPEHKRPVSTTTWSKT